MSEIELSKEEKVLRMVKRVLTDIARDTYAPPGQRHPLSGETMQSMRDCLALIVARENELAEAAGRPNTMRPHYVDEPRKASVVVQLDDKLKRSGQAKEGE
ncbi:MAG TPA: segregation and condensation protein A [Gammaproteobacteria bacterium]|nr:segregation and condensation protein A [Gammaproteobacteria bacterium]